MFRWGIPVAVVVAILDQVSKQWVVDYFAARPGPFHGVIVTGYFNLVLVGNRGISFSLFNSGRMLNELLLVALALAIVTGLLWWLWRVQSRLLAVAIGFIVGGAVGNALDRILRGAVVDFLDFHVGRWHPFVFNLADAAISVGVGLLILDGLLGRWRPASTSEG